VRWLLIRWDPMRVPGGTWVAAETSDEVLLDEGSLVKTVHSVLVTLDDALKDPELEPAVRAWLARDDSLQRAWDEAWTWEQAIDQ